MYQLTFTEKPKEENAKILYSVLTWHHMAMLVFQTNPVGV